MMAKTAEETFYFLSNSCGNVKFYRYFQFSVGIMTCYKVAIPKVKLQIGMITEVVEETYESQYIANKNN